MIFDRIFTSRGEREYNAALEHGNWSQAVQIAHSNKLSDVKIKTAEHAGIISRLITEEKDTLHISKLVSQQYHTLKNPSVMQSLSKDIRNDICLSAVKRSVTEKDFDGAFRFSEIVSGNDPISFSLRLIAASQNLSVDKRLETLKKIKSTGLQSEMIRDLALAQIFAGNPNKGVDIAQVIPDLTTQKYVTIVARYFESEKTITDQQTDPVMRDPFGKAWVLVMQHILDNKVEDTHAIFHGIEKIARNNLITTMSESLCYAGRYNDAFAIVNDLPDENFKFMNICQILTMHQVAGWPQLLYDTLPHVKPDILEACLSMFPCVDLFNSEHIVRIRDLSEPYHNTSIVNRYINWLSQISSIGSIDPS